jgi:hypothetical protein
LGAINFSWVAEYTSLLKNAYIDDFNPLRDLHLFSDFDGQMQIDEVIRCFSTA